MTGGIQLRDRFLACPGRPLLMGILNVTPDSFSDGGENYTVESAVRNALKMREAGAEIIDIGGESTRPGAATISDEEEIARVVPVIAALKQRAPDIVLSIDTRKAAVAEATLAAGAELVNDVSGLSYEPALADVAAKFHAGLILMHMRGTPETMQEPANLVYDDVVGDVSFYLRRATALAIAAGVAPGMIVWDPGIGFSKDMEGNLTLLGRISALQTDGYPLLVGPSRKSFIGKLLDLPDPKTRTAGTVGAACWLASAGVTVLRVHDVAAVREALTVFEACRRYSR